MLALLLLTFVAFTALAVIQNSLIFIMLNHNTQKAGFETAQLEMANLEQSPKSIGDSKRESAEFDIETKITPSAELAETKRLEVLVYEKGKKLPLVNLVLYE